MPKRRQSPYCRSGKRKSVLHLSRLETKISRQQSWFNRQNEQWSNEQFHEGEEGSTKKVTGESSRKILESVREVFERADEKSKSRSRPKKPPQLTVVRSISTNSVLSIHDGYTCKLQ